MKNESLYRKTVDILYDAYFNDTLQHDNFCGCAVGNIVAANMGIKFNIIPNNRTLGESSAIDWEGVKTEEDGRNWYGLVNPEEVWWTIDKQLAEDQISATGYSLGEIIMIEKSFESAYKYQKNEQDNMLDGLMSVLQTLKQIHEVENNDTEVNKFKNHYQCKTQTLNTR